MSLSKSSGLQKTQLKSLEKILARIIVPFSFNYSLIKVRVGNKEKQGIL